MTPNGYFYAEGETIYFKVIEAPMLSIKVAFTDQAEATKLANQLNNDLGANSTTKGFHESFVEEVLNEQS